MHRKYNIVFLFLTLSFNVMSDISNNPSNWYVVTDQVMGGKSELEADYLSLIHISEPTRP